MVLEFQLWYTNNEISGEYIEWISDGRNYQNAFKYLYSIIDKTKLSHNSTFSINGTIYTIATIAENYLEYSCVAGTTDRSYMFTLRFAADTTAGLFSCRCMATGNTLSNSSTTDIPVGTSLKLYY